ncbi:4Fe-4S dicluster domain-containing protein [Candidatus Auribacterota bacterium]
MNDRIDKLVINVDRCKGCGLCVAVCDKNVLAMSKKMNKKGLHYVECIDIDKCVSCSKCAIMCPDVVIEVNK